MRRAVLIYFSPTHTTKRVLHGIAEGLNMAEVVDVDLTISCQNIDLVIGEEDLVVVGTPVHFGRVPIAAMERLKAIRGKGQPIVCVSVYGNNSFGNALMELTKTMENQGFHPIAGAGFIGEHAWSNEKREIAKGRPNLRDLMIAKGFGQRIIKKLEGIPVGTLKTQILNLTGKLPKKSPIGMPKMASRPKENCTMCLKCVAVCPVGAIDQQAICDSSKCIQCCACVKECPENARELKHPVLSVLSFVLVRMKDKEPELFL